MVGREAWMQERAPVARADTAPRLGWQAQVAAVWCAAGAAAAGSLVAALMLLGRMHAVGMASLTLLLAGAGGLLGLVHGSVLGYLGRHAGGEQQLRLRDHAFACLVAGAALLLSILLALWVVLGAVLFRSGRFWGAPVLAVGAVAVVAIGAWATVLGWRSLECAYLEWPDHSIGAALLAGSFFVLWTMFLVLRPAIPGTQLQLSTPGWLIVAALATIWVAMPAVVIALRLRRRPGVTRSRTDVDP